MPDGRRFVPYPTPAVHAELFVGLDVPLQAAGKDYPGAQRHLHFQFYRQPVEVVADSSGQVRCLLQAASDTSHR